MDRYYPNYPISTYSIGPNYNMIYNNLRRKNQGFDIEIQIVENETVASFKAHSQVLIIFSPEFFNTALSDRWNTDKKPEVANENASSNTAPETALKVMKMGVEHADPAFFNEILNFMYTGNIIFRPANIRAVIATAHYLQLTTLLNYAQVYLQQMLSRTPEVRKYQIYQQVEFKDFPKRCSFGEKLYVFENRAGDMMIVVKNIPDDLWMFADSLEFVQTKQSLETSELYVCDKNYIILHPTPTRSLNALPVALGSFYYIGPIEGNVYMCGSGPLGSQCYDNCTKKFADFPLPARGINTFVNYVSEDYPRMIFVVDNGYLNVCQPHVYGGPKWEEYKLPESANLQNDPVAGIDIPKWNHLAPDGTCLPQYSLAFYNVNGSIKRFFFNTERRYFAEFRR